MKVLFYSLFVIFSIAVGCSSSTKKKENIRLKQTIASEPTRQTTNEVNEKEVVLLPTKIELKGKFLKEDAYGIRENLVFLVLDGKKIIVDTIASCEDIPKKAFDSYDIPATAHKACGGWWAGWGEYYYVTTVNNKVELFYGWQDEGQEEAGFHWKLKPF